MKIKKKFTPDPNLKLMDQVRQVLRYHRYSFKTEKAYCNWILKYIKFNGGKKHPREMGKKEIEKFLSHLVFNRNVAASTQKQALNAIIFLYKQVLDISIDEELEHSRSRRHPRLPIVLTQKEVKLVLDQMQGIHLLMAKLLYGGGLRLMECIRLRVGDIDFEKEKLYVRDGKGGKDRVTLFPKSIHEDLRVHLRKVKKLHNQDLDKGYGEVYLPHALARKYPSAAKEFCWQYVFPSKNLSEDPRSGSIRRHHVLESGLQKAVKVAVKKSEINKRVGCHTFRHCFATHLLEHGVNIRVVQELMGHADVKTTEIYTHVMEKNIDDLYSPLDLL